MKLAAIICVSVFALFGACEKKAAATGTPPTAPSATNDADLERRVREAITADTVVAPTITGLQVSAMNGVVTLRGTAKTAKDKDALGAKARSVAGVNNVTNDVTVAGG